MKKSFFAPFVFVALSLAFLLSCTSGSNDNGGGDSSSSDDTSSSSSSSSSDDTPYSSSYDTPVYRQFDSVTIGSQTWMAENLHYAAPGSKCYNNYPENCERYGHLYDWATAMDLPASCNSSTCADQIQPKHRGICPEGWHVPSETEWDELLISVGGSSVAAKYLKAREGWSSCGPLGSGESYLCEDMYGFTALPGGAGYPDGSFNHVVNYSLWWSAGEHNSNYAYHEQMYYSSDRARYSDYGKIALFSLRCVRDSSYDTPVYRQFDSVTIGSQTWMAENLHYAALGSKCYNNSPENCEKYGHLYDWATAMDLPASCNSSTCAGQIQPKHRGICPEGWHVPNETEWNALFTYVGDSSVAGKYLKARESWSSCGPSGSGESYLCEDMYGFAALSGGEGYSNGSFGHIGASSNLWSTGEHNGSYAYYSHMDYDREEVYWNSYGKIALFSLRCIRDSRASYDTPVYRQFNSVTIGSQTWMAGNLYYAVPGSKCYDNRPANCEKYGHLYDWATAMDLPASCNSSTCAGQIQPNHRGICPEGWHVPSETEWDELLASVGGSSEAGKYLKARKGWNSCGPSGSGESHLCEDMYGFAALPGGNGYSNGSFEHIGASGNLWSTGEHNDYYAYYSHMDYHRDEVYWNSYGKIALFSLRCIKD